MDYKVADISLAEWGRKEIEMAEKEMHGLMALCAFPSGDGRPSVPGVIVDDPSVRLGALKMSEAGDRLIIRLFEPTGAARMVRLRVPPVGLDVNVPLSAFEIKTLSIDLKNATCAETDLLERQGAAG